MRVTENCSYDPTGEVNSNADLTVTAATSHSDRLYVYVRRASSSGFGLVPLTYRVYLDLDGDGRLESTDRVLEFTLWFNVLGSPALYEYAPQDTVNGDPMGGPIAGGLAIPSPRLAHSPAPPGRRLRTRGFGHLGRARRERNAPVGMQFAALRGGEVDDTAPISFAQRLVSISEGRSAGTAAGMEVVYEHTVTNTGNVTLPLSIEATSTRGWPLELRVKDTGTPVAPVDLPPGAAITIEAVLSVPVDAPDGARDTVTVTAASTVHPDVKATATNEAAVGPMLVIPQPHRLDHTWRHHTVHQHGAEQHRCGDHRRTPGGVGPGLARDHPHHQRHTTHRTHTHTPPAGRHLCGRDGACGCGARYHGRDAGGGIDRGASCDQGRRLRHRDRRRTAHCRAARLTAGRRRYLGTCTATPSPTTRPPPGRSRSPRHRRGAGQCRSSPPTAQHRSRQSRSHPTAAHSRWRCVWPSLQVRASSPPASRRSQWPMARAPHQSRTPRW